ncbi:hypothetical protein K0038_02223 [Pseudomonas syringae]|nr:hypothetical protein [Pseudomonas syringae]
MSALDHASVSKQVVDFGRSRQPSKLKQKCWSGGYKSKNHCSFGFLPQSCGDKCKSDHGRDGCYYKKDKARVAKRNCAIYLE